MNATNLHIYNGKFVAFKASVLSFLQKIIGEESEYFQTFNNSVMKLGHINLSKELIEKIKDDFENGWLDNLKGIVSAEIFTDFLEMAEHLLDESYKDAAAVIIGSVLENNLRTISSNHGLPTFSTDSKTAKKKAFKAESLNQELTRANIHNVLVQKSVTAWLELRNNAAHGNYQEYDINQVKLMLSSVRDFIIKFT